jgi:Kef-type K+ transport system membrane component KefB
VAAPKLSRRNAAFGFQLFLCVALSISALPIMGRILLEMNLERTALGAMTISTAAIDDVIGWVLLGVATVLATNQFNVAPAAASRWHRGFFLLLQKVVGPALRKSVAQKFPRRARKRECPIPFSRCCSSRCSRAA